MKAMGHVCPLLNEAGDEVTSDLEKADFYSLASWLRALPMWSALRSLCIMTESVEEKYCPQQGRYGYRLSKPPLLSVSHNSGTVRTGSIVGEKVIAPRRPELPQHVGYATHCLSLWSSSWCSVSLVCVSGHFSLHQLIRWKIYMKDDLWKKPHLWRSWGEAFPELLNSQLWGDISTFVWPSALIISLCLWPAVLLRQS